MFSRHGPWRGEAAGPGGEIENLFHFFSFWSPSRREIGLSLRQYFVQSWETLNTVDWRLFDSHQWPGRLHLNTKYYLLCPALVRPLVLVVDPAEEQCRECPGCCWCCVTWRSWRRWRGPGGRSPARPTASTPRPLSCPASCAAPCPRTWHKVNI